MALAAMQPEKIASIPEDMGKDNNDCGPHSPDGVDVELPTATTTAAGDDDDDDGEFESDDSGSDREDEEFQEEREDEEEEDEEDEQHAENVEDMDAADLLALSKSRLGRGAGGDPQTPPATTTAGSGATEEAEGDEDAAGADDDEEEVETLDADAAPRVDEGPQDQAYYVELAMAKLKLEKARLKAENDDDPDYLLKLAEKKLEEARLKAENDNDPEYLLRLAEKKVQEAQAKARADEESMSEDVIKPALPPKPARSENTELWALLNYSKMRLETGTTPQVGKRRDSKSGSLRGDDAASVSSKLSKSSKLSMGSRNNDAPVAVVGGPGGANAVGDEEVGDTDAPLKDVNDNGDASVDGSVSSESATKNGEGSDNSDDDDNDDEEESSDDDQEEEDLPEFLKDNDEGEVDPEEAKALYEAAKFKAASILSVTKDDLSDMQMLQAIAIAEDAAKKGEEKFSTKRSLFKLNEAKVEDLKAFLNFSSSPNSEEGETTKNEVANVVGWGIGRGRLIKKLGTVVKDFKEKCAEIDERTQREKVGQPTSKDMISAVMLDLKAQIDEYEKIVTKGIVVKAEESKSEDQNK